MEFNQKLQQLRKEKGLTQEQLAKSLYVSRTAISKWELGRGYPSLDSIKDIAKFFDVTIDELLSNEQLLDFAKQDAKIKTNNLRDLVFGLLDMCVVMLLFLPFFAQRGDFGVLSVSLLFLTAVETYIKVVFFVVVIGVILFGIIQLIFKNCQRDLWITNKRKISLILNSNLSLGIKYC